MADREQLHALVDSLPEGALESAQTYLKAIQTGPLSVKPSETNSEWLTRKSHRPQVEGGGVEHSFVFSRQAAKQLRYLRH